MSHPGSRLYSALSDLVEISAECQNSGVPAMDLVNWMRQYCTIRLATTRGCGHSCAAEKLLQELVRKHRYNAVRFLGRDGMVIRKDYAQLGPASHGHVIDFGYQQIFNARAADAMEKNIGVVLFDDTWVLSEAREDAIYRRFTPAMMEARRSGPKPVFFIFLH
jgi:hypothetical protein